MRFPGAIVCSERSALGRTLAETITRVYQLMGDLKAAKDARSDPDSIDAVRSSLQACREEELKAERAYREHVEAHGCSAEGRGSAAGVGAAISRHLRS